MPDSMDWVKADVRSCDSCGRETDAGEWPDWVNGICEDCDPEILLDYFDCDYCGDMGLSENATVIHGDDIYPTLMICSNCYKKEK